MRLAIQPFNSILSERRIILIDGWLQQVNVSYHEAHPVWLLCICHLSDLIIKGCHELAKQGSVSETLKHNLNCEIWFLESDKKNPEKVWYLDAICVNFVLLYLPTSFINFYMRQK